MNSVSNDAQMRSTAFSERRDFKRAAVFLLPLTQARLGNGKLIRAFGNYKGPFDYCPRRCVGFFCNDCKITPFFQDNGSMTGRVCVLLLLNLMSI